MLQAVGVTLQKKCTPLETHLGLLYEISPSRAQFLHQHSFVPTRWLEEETPCKKKNNKKSDEQEKYVRSCPGETQCKVINRTGVSTMKKESERMEFQKFPDSTTFAIWKMNFKSDVFPSSSFPTEAKVWINEIDSAWDMDELTDVV